MKCHVTSVIVAVCVLLSIGESRAQEPGSRNADPMAMLMAGRYAELDAVMMTVQSAYRRGTLTDEQLLAAFRPFYDVSNPEFERHFDEWVHARPDSYVARLARGIHYKYVGLAARGDEYASLVPDARLWKRNEGFARAADDLESSIDLDEKPLLSYHHLIDPSGSLLRFTSNRRLLDKAIEIDPRNLVVRRKFLITLPARWGGSLAAMEEFVGECRQAGLPAGHIKELEWEVLNERAWLAFEKEHDYARAEQLYVEVIAGHPDAVKPAEIYISTLVRQEKWNEAIAAATRLLERHPRDSHALASRGLAYVHLEKTTEGVKDYEAAEALGSVWAKKELARLHWQGRFVSQDRAIALQLLRDAARRGDPEAQREFARVTGEKIVTKRPWWFAILPFAGIALLLAALGGSVAYRRSRAPAGAAARRLTHPIGKFLGGAFGFTLFAGLPLAINMYPGRTDNLLAVACFVALAVAAAPAIFAYLFVRHVLSLDGISFTRFNGARGDFKWRAVRHVSYTSRTMRFRFEDGAGKVANISAHLLNMPLFAYEVLRQVPREAIEESAEPLLNALRTLHGFADWSNADIEAQESGAGTRIIMMAGTEVCEVALFAWNGRPDEAIRFETGEDGDFLLHLYVGVPVPEGVTKYSLPGSKRFTRLRVSDGRIAFMGVESMPSDFRANADIRSDAEIPAGDYEIESYRMAYPMEMIHAAMRKYGEGLRSPRMWIPPVLVALAVLAGIGALVVGSLWVGGALFGLAAVGGKIFHGSATRRALVSRYQDAKRNFPNFVVMLTLRSS